MFYFKLYSLFNLCLFKDGNVVVIIYVGKSKMSIACEFNRIWTWKWSYDDGYVKSKVI